MQIWPHGKASTTSVWKFGLPTPGVGKPALWGRWSRPRGPAELHKGVGGTAQRGSGEPPMGSSYSPNESAEPPNGAGGAAKVGRAADPPGGSADWTDTNNALDPSPIGTRHGPKCIHRALCWTQAMPPRHFADVWRTPELLLPSGEGDCANKGKRRVETINRYTKLLKQSSKMIIFPPPRAARTWQTLDQIWAKSGQSWPSPCHVWSTLAESGQTSVDVQVNVCNI